MLSNFDRYPLTFGPTPIERLSRLTAHLGGDVEIFAKREDCNSGLAFGGNKLRKLEYIVPDAIASNADTLRCSEARIGDCVCAPHDDGLGHCLAPLQFGTPEGVILDKASSSYPMALPLGLGSQPVAPAHEL